MSRSLSPGRALWRFGIRQTYKGALIMAVLISSMFAIQAIGYQAAYPDEQARAQFAASMQSAPALGILYGEPENLTSATGYMVYRVVPVFSLVAALWGLLTASKLLRGQEEDGRWEQIISANTTARRAVSYLLLGFGTTLTIASLLSSGITFIATQELSTSFSLCLLLNLAVFLPAALFAAFGVLVSQLAVTRRRALMYGLIPLLVLFVFRALGNTITELDWLKQFTPFGWSELLNPVLQPQLMWIIPFAVGSLLLFIPGLYFAGKRDLGASIIPESDTASSRFFLLTSASALTIRQNGLAFICWGIGALAISGIVAAVSNVAARSLQDSPQFEAVVARMGGSFDDLKIAFLGAGALFTVIVLLLMAAVSIGSIRSSEAKNHLDNLLVQPIRRSSWLISRLIIIVVVAALIITACTITTWAIGQSQGIHIDLGNFMLVSSTQLSAVIFALGLGSLVYGLAPRLASASMYIVIIWSFLIDIIASIVELPDIIAKSSLFHYISLSPTASPDWAAFGWLSGLGIVMMTLGVVIFTKRDIISE